MKTISLTVPMDYNALTRASDMLHGLAIDLSKEQPAATVEQITEAEVNAGNIEPAPAEVFASPKPAAAPVAEVQPKADLTQAPATTATESAPAPAPSVTEPATPTQTTSVAPALTATDAAPSEVEVDSDGLPWDHRIHALGAGGAHNKLKKTQQWKKKRGVDAALVAEVEAELRAAMSAGPANPVVTEPAGNAATVAVEPSPAPAPPASPTAAPTTAAAAVQPASPAPAPADGITTFPALMAAMTGAGFTAASPEVLTAVNAQGLQALPLLAARPDLIPAVAAALGV